MLPLTFDDLAGYDRTQEGDVISLTGVDGNDLQAGKQVTMEVVPKQGDRWTAKLNHSYHAHQISRLRHGSALNFIKKSLLGV